MILRHRIFAFVGLSACLLAGLLLYINANHYPRSVSDLGEDKRREWSEFLAESRLSVPPESVIYLAERDYSGRDFIAATWAWYSRTPVFLPDPITIHPGSEDETGIAKSFEKWFGPTINAGQVRQSAWEGSSSSFTGMSMDSEDGSRIIVFQTVQNP